MQSRISREDARRRRPADDGKWCGSTRAASVAVGNRDAVALIRSGACRSCGGRSLQLGRSGLAQRPAFAQKVTSHREAHIPTQHPPQSPQARLSRQNAHPRRPCDHQGSPRQGPHPADGLIWRISERRAFQDLARSGRRARTETLWCSYVNDPSASPLRVAFSVGKAVGPATTRNLVRRRLRALVSATSEQLAMGSGWLLIGTKPGATERTFVELSGEVSSLLNQVSVVSSPVPPESR